MSKLVNVLVFGVFDPLHEGHRFFFRQAKSLGDLLLVVLARDSSIRATKHHEPFQSEEARLAAVAVLPEVDEAMLGNKTAHHYELLSELEFDVVAMGYDQMPREDEVRSELNARGKHEVKIVRLPAFRPDIHKSSMLRKEKKQ